MKLAPALLLLLCSAAALAQPVYRNVGPDGRVTFSDQPQPSARASVVGSTGANAAPELPAALRQPAGRHPVTLFSGRDCPPCDDGRALLRERGIPFAEKTIQTPADAAALTRLGADMRLPLLTVGARRLVGFFGPEWSAALDAAGYPATSVLPRHYPAPQAQPLAPEPPAAAASAPANAQTAQGEPGSSGAAPTNPVPPAPPGALRF